MAKINIGTCKDKNVNIDLDILLKTRLLIQANSGGGKSWAIRRIAEQAFGKVQIIIIDPEGEFPTLREKFDFILVGKGGETPADTRSAALVAHKLLELHASAVCDLYEMKPSQRHEWVKLFLESLVDAPKNLWHPLLVIVDEAHVFCPEKGAGESVASEAMISLATRGRKRQFCAIWATQRLSKVKKDASGEMLNRLVGPTFEDVDLKRAAELLSILPEDRREFDEQMRIEEPGNFHAIGRAISKTRLMVRIGQVQTTHEMTEGKYTVEPPPAPEKIKALLPKLSDLPQEAEQKARNEAELKKENAELRRQLSARPTIKIPEVQVKEVEISVLKNDELQRLEQVAKEIGNFGDQFVSLSRNILTTIKSANTKSLSAPRFIPRQPVALPVRQKPVQNGDEKLGKAHRSILTVLAQYPQGRTDVQLALLSGYAVGTGGFNNAIGNLRTMGYLTGNKSNMQITQEGLNTLGEFEILPIGSELVEYWKRKLGKAERQAFEVLVSIYPNDMDRDELAISAGYSAGTGGINNAIGRLCTLELATKTEARRLRAAETLFE